MMIQRTPLYIQVRDLLAQRIAVGEWHGAIPNEYDLSRSLDISVGTLRKAVDLLVEERLLCRRQGKGTFIRDRLAPDYGDAFEPIRAADGERLDVDWLGLSSASVLADADERKHLRLADDAPVLRLTRVGRVGARRIIHECACLPADRFGDLADLSPAQMRIVPLAHRFGVILGGANERVTLERADADVAPALAIASGKMVLRLDRIVHADDGMPLEWRIARCHLVDELYRAPPLELRRTIRAA